MPVKRTTNTVRGRNRAKPNLYEILQVHPRARPEQIRNAFRRVALRFHPDRNPSSQATSRFLQAIDAFKILSDAGKRAAYDRRLAGGSKRRLGVPALRQRPAASEAPGPARIGKRTLDLVAIFLAVSLPICVGAAEAFGYRRSLYALAGLFALALVRVFRLR